MYILYTTIVFFRPAKGPKINSQKIWCRKKKIPSSSFGVETVSRGRTETKTMHNKYRTYLFWADREVPEAQRVPCTTAVKLSVYVAVFSRPVFPDRNYCFQKNVFSPPYTYECSRCYGVTRRGIARRPKNCIRHRGLVQRTFPSYTRARERLEH